MSRATRDTVSPSPNPIACIVRTSCGMPGPPALLYCPVFAALPPSNALRELRRRRTPANRPCQVRPRWSLARHASGRDFRSSVASCGVLHSFVASTSRTCEKGPRPGLPSCPSALAHFARPFKLLCLYETTGSSLCPGCACTGCAMRLTRSSWKHGNCPLCAL